MNSSTFVVTLGRDPEDASEYVGRPARKLRVVDKTFGKSSIDRWFDATVTGPDVDTADRLKAGDQLVLTGTLQLTEYELKKDGKSGKKGDKVREDKMPFAKILQVTRSATFFNKDVEPAETASESPLAGLV